MPRPVLSVVTPVYNEEAGIREFYARLKKVLDGTGLSYEMLFIDDGSRDASLEILHALKRSEPRVRVLSFSRNFGHQIAVKAGIDHAQGEAVVIIDSDLQDPPETIPVFIAKWREGHDVVYATRVRRKGESGFKIVTASLYYRLLRKMTSVDVPLETGDFRLISARVAAVLRGIKEQHPYFRGLVAWAGFKQTSVPVDREARYAGASKYSLKKMLHLAWSGVTHFSFVPMQLATVTGLLTLALCALWFSGALFAGSFEGAEWTALFFLGGVQLLSVGILGSYLGRNYDEARSRPLYILAEEDGPLG